MTTTHDEPPRDRGASDLDSELRPVADALRRMPAVRPGATARVVAAARGEPMPLAARRRRPSVGLTAAAAAVVVLAAGIGLVRRHGTTTTAASATQAIGADATVSPVIVHRPGDVGGTTATLASGSSSGARLTTTALTESGELDDAAVSTAFVLKLPEARRIALVGDFNGWSPTANALERTANGVWTVTVALTPGRHAYGFVVDDTLWVRDPRAAVEHDADYGRDHSVIVVGRP